MKLAEFLALLSLSGASFDDLLCTAFMSAPPEASELNIMFAVSDLLTHITQHEDMAKKEFNMLMERI
jgi:hypothetical protein